jgi:uncharacterized protein (DUF4213/DUF364 family)
MKGLGNVSTIDTLLQSLSVDAPVKQVLAGAFWTAVVLEADPPRCGIASTMHGGHHGHHLSGPPLPEAGDLLACGGRELAEWLRSENALKAGIGMAAFNALLALQPVPAEGYSVSEINAEDVIIEHGHGRKVAVVGHFPFVERVRQAADECWVLELDPRPGDVPAERAEELLPQADVVALTGTSLINHTFDDLMALCHPEALVLLLGPSAPLTPALFDAGISGVSGTRVTDPERVLLLVGQGATFRQIKRGGGVRLLTMMRER